MAHHKHIPVLLLIGWTLTGCHSFGPNSLEGTHALYNQAIVNSLNEQFLQNLVRLRYRDTPYFLEVGSVTASLKLEAGIGLETELSTGSGPDLFMPSAGVTYSTTPTISYAPLQGEDFLKNVLTPVSLESLFVLSQSGWSTRRIYGMCVERINGLRNAPTASGPTPDRSPADPRPFNRLIELLDRVRQDEVLRSTIEPGTGKMLVQITAIPEHTDTIREIKELLNLDPGREEYEITGDFFSRRADAISIRTRSIISILFYLSQNIQTPVPHREAGWVTVTRNADGAEFDWNETALGNLFQVRSGRQRPAAAFLAVPYRGHWFYIADDDLESKSTFMLLTQLFSLQAGEIKTTGPTLTIPVSR